MLLVFVAIMVVYIMLLGFVLYGGLANLKFAGCFRKGINVVNLGAAKADNEDRQDAKFSILHGRFQTPPIMPKSKGRGGMRNGQTQKYYDNRFFTSLSSEKKELLIKPQDEALNFLRERGDFKTKLGYFKGCHQGLNLDPLDDSGCRPKEARQPSLEAYLAFMNFNSSCSSFNQRNQRSRSPGCSRKDLAGLCSQFQVSQNCHKKIRLSRGLLNRPRRRHFVNRVESRDLSVIPERDESEERTSINVSGTRFTCQASDNSTVITSPALC